MKGVELSPWVVTEAHDVFVANPWIRIEKQQIQLPSGATVNEYYQIELSDYCIVFAETADGMVIVERQYKHGAGQVTLTLPAGSIEENEAPLDAAQRELLEETGYTSDQWQGLGSYILNGNYRCGRAHLFRASQVRRTAEPNSGDLEDMEIVLMSVEDLIDAVRGESSSAFDERCIFRVWIGPPSRAEGMTRHELCQDIKGRARA